MMDKKYQILVSDEFIPAISRLVEIVHLIRDRSDPRLEFFNRLFDDGKVNWELIVASRAIYWGTVLEPAKGLLEFIATYGAGNGDGDDVNVKVAGEAGSDTVDHGGSFHE